MPSARRTARRPRPARDAGPRRPAPAAEGRRPLLRAWEVAAALAVLHVAVTLLSLNPVPHQGGDNAAYLALARSILEHGQYRELWDPANAPHTQYPPGFPLILAGAMLLGVKPFAGFKVLIALVSGAVLALTYLWARRVSTAGVAAAVGLLLALGPGVVAQSQLELSDVPFWTFTFLSLWAFARADRRRPADADDEAGEGAAGELPMGWVALGAAGTLCAWMTRSAALPLVLAVVAWLAAGRRWRALGVFAAVFVPVAGAWMLRQAMAGGAEAYVTPFWMVDPYRPALGTIGPVELLERVWSNGEKYLTRHLPFLVVGIAGSTVGTAFAAALTTAAAAGWARRLRRPRLAELFLPLYLGLVLVWPAEWADDRFLLPALPLLLLYAGETVARLARLTPAPRVAGAAVAVLLALASLPTLDTLRREAARCRLEYRGGSPLACQPPAFAGVFQIAREVRGRLPEGAAVLSRKPTLFWAFSGYPSRMYPLDADPAVFLEAARDAGARYVVLDRSPEGARYLRPVTAALTDRFCVFPGVGGDFGALTRIDRNLPPPPAGAPSGYMYYCRPEPGERLGHPAP